MCEASLELCRDDLFFRRGPILYQHRIGPDGTPHIGSSAAPKLD